MKELFSERFTGETFEEQSLENGFTYWLASKLMELLDYKTMVSFSKAINKAMTTCNTLNIPILENFIQVCNIVDGRPVNDFKLSRFACYLVTMNADNKNPKVAQAQVYFIIKVYSDLKTGENKGKKQRTSVKNLIPFILRHSHPRLSLKTTLLFPYAALGRRSSFRR